MFYAFLLVLPHLASTATQVGVNNRVDGDQTVGGVHLFELHSPSGGMGFGLKVLLIVIIVGVAIYWYIQRQTRAALKRHLPTTVAAAASYASPALELQPFRPLRRCGNCAPQPCPGGLAAEEAELRSSAHLP